MLSSRGSKRLLLADDDAATRCGLAEFFRELGYEVRAAKDGAQAWAAATESRPDLVVTDLEMPNLDGVELIRRLHAQDPNLPVVVVSSRSPVDLGRACVGLRARRYFIKPLILDELYACVRDLARIDVAERDERSRHTR